jgi:ADP-heptose:LPS heptosyltransferase
VPDHLPRTLAVRLDNDGDVLLTGPALRALAAGSRRLDLLVSPAGAAAARMLPSVDEVLVFDSPWSGDRAPAAEPAQLDALVRRLAARAYDEAVVFTSFHQSSLPMAMVARWAGVPRTSAYSEDHPGSLLDLRLRRVPGADDDGVRPAGHEVEAALRLAEAAGFPLPTDDDRRLRIRPVRCPDLGLPTRYVVVHPMASVPSRSLDLEHAAGVVAALGHAGWPVVVTGSPGQEEAGRRLAAADARDLVGRTTYTELAGVLSGAACVVSGNTGPAHLAAAVGTPVVSLFSPVVPAERWAPWGVPTVVLGDQTAPCRGTRSRTCPVPGHPCLSGVSPHHVVDAVHALAGTADGRRGRTPHDPPAVEGVS